MIQVSFQFSSVDEAARFLDKISPAATTPAEPTKPSTDAAAASPNPNHVLERANKRGPGRPRKTETEAPATPKEDESAAPSAPATPPAASAPSTLDDVRAAFTKFAAKHGGGNNALLKMRDFLAQWKKDDGEPVERMSEIPEARRAEVIAAVEKALAE